MALLVMGFWLVLNGRVAFDTLILGAFITLAMTLLGHFSGLWTIKREMTVYRLLPAGFVYFFALLKEILLANFNVIKLIIKHDEQPVIRHYVTPLKTKAARAALASSITLTPGTVTVQLEGNVLTVHCLSRALADGLDGWCLEKRLVRMEEKVNGKTV